MCVVIKQLFLRNRWEWIGNASNRRRHTLLLLLTVKHRYRQNDAQSKEERKETMKREFNETKT